MDYKVLKDFNTTQRRLKVGPGPGGRINDQEVFEPFTLADLLDRNFLEPIEEEQPAVAAAPAAEQEAPSGTFIAEPAPGAKPARTK